MRRLAILSVLLSTACGPRESGPGRLSVAWKGTSSGHFSAAASARWCAADSLLEIIAVHEDTASGLSILSQDTLQAGPYPVIETRTYTPGRPQAAVALRWLTEAALKGYESFGGVVTVTEGGKRAVSGTLDVRLRVAGGADTLHLTGAFQRIPIEIARGPCGRADKPRAG